MFYQTMIQIIWQVGTLIASFSSVYLPGGIPASSANFIKAKADRGVSSAGLSTQVHPAANAAPI